MFEDEDEILPPKPEEIPPGLARKWEEQEKNKKLTRCGKCRKQVLAENTICNYCGSPVNADGDRWIKVTAFILLGTLLFWGARMFFRH